MKTIKKGLIILLIGASTSIFAENIYIDGTVESRCSIFTDTSGFWGNPSAFKLSTLPADGGRVPVIRYDVSLASAYRAEISTPISFSSSPTLSDSTVLPEPLRSLKPAHLICLAIKRHRLRQHQIRELMPSQWPEALGSQQAHSLYMAAATRLLSHLVVIDQ